MWWNVGGLCQFYGSKKILGQKDIRSEIDLGQKRSWAPKLFGQKNCVSKKNIRVQKDLVQKHFGTKTILSKKN